MAKELAALSQVHHDGEVEHRRAQGHPVPGDAMIGQRPHTSLNSRIETELLDVGPPRDLHALGKLDWVRSSSSRAETLIRDGEVLIEHIIGR
jgi:hypothetical protein